MTLIVYLECVVSPSTSIVFISDYCYFFILIKTKLVSFVLKLKTIYFCFNGKNKKIHRTLMYGGIFGYPSDTDQHPNGNLQLLYKCAPMGYIVSQAGGLCTNGEQNLLDIRPSRVHERSPVFMGSPEDMKEMMEYVKHTNYVDEEEEEK
uniref:D-fructose-1,6-bisphosphate 1-phosphohydrolase n=1 Tax=Ditylum brightwellii TaxID=49249 RepID=A0A7S4UG64_9STRA